MKKKIAAIALATIMAVGAFGCGGNGGAGSSSAAASSAAASSAAGSSAAASSAAAGSSSAAKDTYIIATDTAFAPFEYEDSTGKRLGIDMDLMEAIAKDQGFKYEIKALGFDASLQALEAGQCDGVIAGMSITDKRKEKFDFSEAYYNVPVTIAVKADASIASLDDLKGKNVAVKKGTTGATFAESIKDKYNLKITVFDDSPTMYQEIQVGNSVACFEDYPVMAYAIKENKSLKLKVVEAVKEMETPYGFAVKKGQNADLLTKFNAGLANIKKNGVFDEIINRYTK
ncbi:MAG: transporter substrate-binding domain-containing protein [Lachnospiraceae bacterium]|nr:transporter substrate-binding domain-containing protein [Lachnospiraceae bacterium]